MHVPIALGGMSAPNSIKKCALLNPSLQYLLRCILCTHDVYVRYLKCKYIQYMVIVQSCPCLVYTFRHTNDFAYLLVDGNRSNSYAGLMATTMYSTCVYGFTHA